MRIHKSITVDRVLAMHEADEGGAVCYSCGVDHDGFLEPDAERVKCHACGDHAVYGYLNLLVEWSTCGCGYCEE
jgi:hypothetical protein